VRCVSPVSLKDNSNIFVLFFQRDIAAAECQLMGNGFPFLSKKNCCGFGRRGPKKTFRALCCYFIQRSLAKMIKLFNV